jgi:ABC-type Fe3+ transport system permease subunit
MSALRRNIPAIRVALLAVFLGLAVAFAFTQYDLARQTLRVICSSCLGLGG